MIDVVPSSGYRNARKITLNANIRHVLAIFTYLIVKMVEKRVI